MGLDMYLYKRHYIGNEHRANINFPLRGIKSERITEITEEVAYWRKANQIHKWFVETVQNGIDDCRDYYVDREQLQKLLDLCQRVLKASKLVKGQIENGYSFENGERVPNLVDGQTIEDPTMAKELLPTQEGFFFGSCGYDAWYLDDIKYTADTLEKLLKEEAGDFYYCSSW